MHEDEAVALTRAHLESQFPKVCSNCGRRFGSLREYLETTTHVGLPVSYDVDAGDMRPNSPLGTMSFANCVCGTTMTLGSAGMDLLTLWRLMAWGRGEAARRGVPLGQVIAGVRMRIDAQVLQGAPALAPRGEPSDQLREWRTSLALLYVNGVAVLFPLVLALWVLVRTPPRLGPPLLHVTLCWVATLAVRLWVPRRHVALGGLAVTLLTGMAMLPFLGVTAGVALVLLSGVVLATAVYGPRAGLLATLAAAAEYVLLGALVSNGDIPAPEASFGDPALFSNWLRSGGVLGLTAGTLVVGLSRLFRQVENAWREEEAAAKRERRANEERVQSDAARRRAEEAARAAQRLESVGRLAGGVAHDFNNLLLVILAWADDMEDRDAGLRATAREEIRKAASQAAHLTRRLLTFARRDSYPAPEQPLDVDSTVNGLLTSLRRLLPGDVRIAYAPSKVPGIALDEGAMGQILVNLALNAADAMPSGGQLSLSTMLVEPAALPPAAMDPTVPHVVLRVADTGTGMDAETLQHLFEPFFSTKGTGRGTGLGLASIYGITQQAGGWCQVESSLGHGTVFQLGFPVMTADARAPDQRPTPDSKVADVLVVEDDERVRDILGSVLRSAGHRVLAAGDVSEALTTARRFKGDLRLLITDGVMPGEPTRKLVDEYLRMFPDGRVLVCSGHSEEDLARRGLTADVASFLAKPFAGEALVARVSELLSAPRSGRPN